MDTNSKNTMENTDIESVTKEEWMKFKDIDKCKHNVKRRAAGLYPFQQPGSDFSDLFVTGKHMLSGTGHIITSKVTW